MEEKYEKFYVDIKKLAEDFKKKKNNYYSRYIFVKICMVVFASCSTIFISLTFISKFEVLFKILSVAFSGLSSIFIALDKVLDFKLKWIQRTKTFVKLQELKREIKYYLMEEKDESKKIEIFRNLFNKAEQIFDNDLDLWVKATEENERKA